MPRAKVYPPGSPVDLFGSVPEKDTPQKKKKEEQRQPVQKGGKGFLMRCIEIIIQDAGDKIHPGRREARMNQKELDNFWAQYGPKKPGNGDTV